VLDYNETDAVKALTNAGFKVEKTYAYSDSVAEGKVISQSPSANNKAKEGDTITITISQGTEQITVADVTSASQICDEGTARQRLQGLNVSVTTEYSDHYSKGIVMAQSIAAGTKVAKNTEITLTVSAGPDPNASTTTTTTVTDTTYRFAATLTNPGDERVYGASIVLYDTAGNELASWPNQSIESFGTDGLKLSKTGLSVSEGKLVVTWLGSDGAALPNVNLYETSVTFSKEN
jgi:serine/threonine-protein kinase